uniref:Uncharacterized protein n=1 Tax=Lepeophtheirus salmonis TaxID=72036 RepID=A0A0K2TFE0_LEPSM
MVLEVVHVYVDEEWKEKQKKNKNSKTVKN